MTLSTSADGETKPLPGTPEQQGSDPEEDAPADEPAPEGSAVGERRGGMARWLDSTRATVLDRVEAFERQWPPVAVLRAFVSRYVQVNGVVLAGHLAFRSFTFLFPLALVVVALAGLAQHFGYDPGETADKGMRLGSAIGNSIRTAGREADSAPYHMAFVALVGLVLGTLGMLSGLHYVFAQAWQVDQRKVEGRFAKMWRLALSFLFLGIVISGSGIVRNSGLIIGALGTFAVGAVFFAAFLGLGMMMPRRCNEWYWLIPGAIVGAVGLEGLQIFGSWYLPDKVSSLSAMYGTLAIAVVLLSYLFLLGQIIVASAITSAVWFDFRTRGNQQEAVG